MKDLIISEKPNLARTVVAALETQGEHFTKKEGCYESQNYIVSYCFGHLYELQDLDKYFADYDPDEKPRWTLDKLPFYPARWEFSYESKTDPRTGKADAGVQSQLKVLRGLLNSNEVRCIYHDGDADNEGQAIVDNVIKYNMTAKKPVYRMWLPTLSTDDILAGIKTAKPDEEYKTVYDAALARAAVDWMVGIELTRYSSIKAQRFVRIGRCVCPIVAHIVQREKDIKEFVPKQYYGVASDAKTNGEQVELTSKKTFEKGREGEARALADRYNAAGAVVTDVKTERKTVKPGKLFSMSDLQSYACKVDKALSPAIVLETVQALYEKAYVSYPRTSSNYLGESEVARIDAVIAALRKAGHGGIQNKAGNKNIYDSTKVESHSALTPLPKIPTGLTGNEKTIYDIILNRFLAVFCSDDCLVDKTTMSIQCADEIFTLTGTVQVQAGWRAFEKADGDKLLPNLKAGDKVNVAFAPAEKMTKAPARYTVAELNGWMKSPLHGEDKPDDYTDEEYKDIVADVGICTEATRADTLERCEKSKYIQLKKGVYYGLEDGFFLVDVMTSLGISLDVPATLALSRSLHKVKTGTISKDQVFEETKNMLGGIISGQKTIESSHASPAGFPVVCKCPKCGGDIIDTPKAFGCSNRSCGLAFWKDDKFLASIGKKPTVKMVTAFCTKGAASLTKCVGKSGKQFDCTVKVTFPADSKYPKYELSFNSKKK